MTSMHAKTTQTRRPTCTSLPTAPGTYYWSEWKRDVRVYKKPGSKFLYVAPPDGVEIRVTPFIAGTFRRTG